MRLLMYLGLAALVAGCSAVPGAPPVASMFEVVTSAPEHSTPGERLGTIAVRVLDSRGNPVPDWPVTWSGDGEVVPDQERTNEAGVSSATWTLPRYPEDWFGDRLGPSGAQRATASADGLESVHFSTNARALTMEQIDVEGGYACGIRSEQLWCWGGLGGVLGRAFNDGRHARQIELPAGVKPIGLVALGRALCVLDTEGAVRCKGNGGGTQFEPVQGLPALKSIDGSGRPGFGEDGFFCGLSRDSNQAWCFGMDARETGISPHPPFLAGELQFATVESGYQFGCGLTASGEVWCWGNNQRGQLGDGTTVDRVVPARVTGLPASVSLTVSSNAVCTATNGGDIWCWGAWGAIPSDSPIPLRVTIPGVRGRTVILGANNEGHVIDAGQHHWWSINSEILPFTLTRHRLISTISESGQACVLTLTNEVFCSWILALGGGDTLAHASELIAIREPEP